MNAQRRRAVAGASPTAAPGAAGLTIPKMFAGSLAYLSLALGGSLFYRVSGHVLGPGAFMLSVPKIFTGSLAPFIAIMGAVGSALGLAIGVAERRAFDRSARPPSSPCRGFRLSTLLVVGAGATGAVISASHVRQVTADRSGFEEAFGPGWRSAIPPELAPRMLQSRRTWKVSDPAEPRWERDVAFWTVPGSDRRLMADVWQPPPGVKPSGLAFVYLHGGGYVAFDKDRGTRPMFRHLAAQGHVVMDVSYRLYPETNISGMVGDTLRAVAWMKRNAAKYGVDPARIVLAGGSAGAHLALLAAYAPEHPLFMPADVHGDELDVRGVVAYYSPGDWRPERKLATKPGPVNAAVRRLLLA